MLFNEKLKQILHQRLEESNPLIQVLIGPRQVGKTTIAKALFDPWSQAKIMVTADSPSPPDWHWVEFHWQQARLQGKKTLLIIDEIQKVLGWSEVVKKLFDEDRDHRDLRILFLGSSSLDIQHGLSESLAGRFELLKARHWSYADCHLAFDWDFQTYLKFGGYPGASKFISDEERWRDYILHSIIEPVLSKDILGQVRIAKPALFRQCFELCMNYPAQEISLQKLLGQLQDKGNAETIKNYLEFLEKSFLIKIISKYSGSKIVTRTSSPKIIVLNTALVNAYHTGKQVGENPEWQGHLFESLMGAYLACIPHNQLYYWREKNLEVDYVIKTPNGLRAIEIKSGRKKNTTAGLQAFAQKYPKAKCMTWNFDDCLEILKNPEKIQKTGL
jgi:predicted AAA+ superfamily ATPase